MEMRCIVMIKLVACIAFMLLISQVSAQKQGAWQRGRATYYGAPENFSAVYDPSRGEGSFGIIAYGACGYTELPAATSAFPIDAVAAPADTNPDYPGSCGRCYEVRCVPGIVLDSPGKPVKIVDGNFDGDRLRPVLWDINPNATDTQGRPWPGNSAALRNESYVQCNNDTDSIRVRIVDSCPCRQVLNTGEVKRQEWCCGGEPHYDLSYWAFEKLAHPVYGAQMIDFRPVDCEDGTPLLYLPGYVSPVIYGDGIQPGWSWFPYYVYASQLRIPNYGPKDNLPATCVHLATGGGLQLKCREGSKKGYQPFANVTTIKFWIRSNSTVNDYPGNPTPKGEVPRIKVFLRNADTERYCALEPYLNATTPSDQIGPWYRVSLPIDSFGCGKAGMPLEDLNEFDFQNTSKDEALFCIADLELVHSSRAVPSPAQEKVAAALPSTSP